MPCSMVLHPVAAAIRASATGRLSLTRNGKCEPDRLLTVCYRQPSPLSFLPQAAIAKSKDAAAEYHKLLSLRMKEQRERRSESLSKRRASKLSEAKSKPEGK